MAAVETKRERRNEPVIIATDQGDVEGTIEFGDDRELSVYTECAGRSTGRVVLRGRIETARVRSDPGGLRPVWASFGKP